MTPYRSAAVLLTLLAFVVILGSADAVAQKKKPVSPPPSVVEQQRTPAPPPAGKGGAALKDLLVHYKGQVTSLGRLKQVEGDYIVVDDDGTEMIYPITAIRSIKVLKVDEENPDENASKLDIKLQ